VVNAEQVFFKRRILVDFQCSKPFYLEVSFWCFKEELGERHLEVKSMDKEKVLKSTKICHGRLS